jgi:hypothetical protein
MQTKLYNSYRITHKNGSVEKINAENLIEALKNMGIDELTSPVLQTFMEEEGIRTLVADMPAEIPFTSVVNDEAGGSIATPLSGTVHVGDQLSFKAIPARNYVFKNWKLNDVVISEDAEFVCRFPDLGGEASAIFKATFEPAPVEWTAEVSPSGASSAGALVFPASGVAPANGSVSILAEAGEGWQFDHWERNGESVGTNRILSATATPLAESEASAVYKAVFTEA